MDTGVYCLCNKLSGKRYIGSAAKSLRKRFRSHRYRLNKGEHFNEHLQRAWRKYGSEAFIFYVLEKCPSEQCIEREQYWIDRFKSYDRAFGYNKSPTAGSPLGVKHSEQFGRRISALMKGVKKSKEHAAAIKAGKQIVSLETRAKMADYARNRKPEHKLKLASAMAGNKNGAGVVQSVERRAKIAEKARLRWKRWREMI